MSKTSGKEFQESIESTPRTHDIEQSTIGGKISEDNIGSRVDTVNHESEDGVTYSIKNVSRRMCDCGHFQDQKAKLFGKCQRCGIITCSAEGCGYTCWRCGLTFCRRHVSVYSDEQAYCSGCKWHKCLMILFEIIKKVVK